MKGKSLNAKFYAGGDSNVASESKNTAEGFKKGGKVGKHVKMEGHSAKEHAGRKPRKSGGAVLSSASSGTPRGKASHY